MDSLLPKIGPASAAIVPDQAAFILAANQGMAAANSGTMLKSFVENPFQHRVHAPQAIDHRLCPIEIRPLPYDRPAGGRAGCDIPQIADFVRQFDQFCLTTDRTGVYDLKTLAFGRG